MRVLLVDDDPDALRWIERSLAPEQSRWQIDVAHSAEAALDIMARSPAQVVVSDMRMPGLTGAELLARVKEEYPDTVRLIVADYTDRHSVVECVGTAHQFLSKPCHPEELRSAIDRACQFKAGLRSDRIKSLIAQMHALPSMPSVLQELFEAIGKDDASLEEIGEIIARDMAMTAKLLQLVNSGFFGLQAEVTTSSEAVCYLGVETVKALLLRTQAFSAFNTQTRSPVSLEALWRHSLSVAGKAREIARDLGAERSLMEECFIAGMLHDIGKLALAVNLPEQYQHVFTAAQDLGLSLHAAEEAAFGAHHGDIGGYMLQLWGLPTPVVNGISFHHEPERAPGEEFGPAIAVYIANCLAHEAANPGSDFLRIDLIEKWGLSDRVPVWRDGVAPQG